jgi:cell division septation protein DedD
MPYTSDKRLYLNRDQTAIVPEDSAEAASLLVAEGGQISDELAAKYGLTNRVPEGEDTAKAEGQEASATTTTPAPPKPTPAPPAPSPNPPTPAPTPTPAPAPAPKPKG